nr:adenylate kinase isoenzyme 5 [Cavia porcellus]
MCSKPEDPVEYLESCLQKVKELGGCDKVKWDTFVSQEKKTLPPLNGGQSRRSFLRNVMPENSNFPYRRYDRLPPIHQFSIESDTDLSETAELIEEYEVFDPARPRPKIILVIGGPGSGKGTQSLKIAERYGFQYISVGELLRKKIHSASSNRKWSLIAKIITNGELAPQETTITEIKQKLMQIPDEEGIVIDGFPRDVAQALSFEDQICTPDLVVFLTCANQRLKERLLKRAEQQGRPDDNLKATQRRLVNFKQNAGPLVKYFQEKGLIMTFDADRNEDEVFYDISLAVDSKLFPNKEAAVGDFDPCMMLDPGDIMDPESDYEDQADDQASVYGEDTTGGLVEDLRKCKIIFVMGGPGSGKGAQCEKLAAKYGLVHLSPGRLLRAELASNSERSRLIRASMERGEPAPSIPPPKGPGRKVFLFTGGSGKDQGAFIVRKESWTIHHVEGCQRKAGLAAAEAERALCWPARVTAGRRALHRAQFLPAQASTKPPPPCLLSPARRLPRATGIRWSRRARTTLQPGLGMQPRPAWTTWQAPVRQKERARTRPSQPGYQQRRASERGLLCPLQVGDPHLVIGMDCSADTMTSRLLQRSPGSAATEDATKTVAKRLETYYRACLPVLAHYEGRTQLRKVNAEGTPEEVFLQLCKVIDSLF